MAEQPITVPCKIHFIENNRDESTIRFLFENIPFVFKFSALYNFGFLPNGDDNLRLANLYVNDDRTICSLLDIRNYSQFGSFAPPNDRREVTRQDQDGFEDVHTRTERIIDIISAGSETERLKLAVTLTNFIYIITTSEAMADRVELQRLYPIPFEDYYNNPQQDDPENIIVQIFQKLRQTFPDSVDAMIFSGGKKKNDRRSCRTRYKAKHAKHSKSKKRYRKSKKRMLRS